ncbi:cytochrome P450 [Collybia nuda]|uniref:Cytochrome P450 n=1 Tax=Collybia nuda TaxID=64659 RepID=A0A9P6CM03_9AGAR|nr:cytochrome P450 [Collybia nuda]
MFRIIWVVVQAGFGVFTAYHLLAAIRRLFYDPLSRFPGPKLAAATDVYMAYYSISGRLVDQLEILHNCYGPVIRISPKQLHFTDPQAFDEIYTNAKYTKEPYFYDAFMEQQSSFGFIDIAKAKARKDILRPLFSRRAILKLEGVVQTTVDKLVSRILSPEYTQGAPVNLRMAYLATSMEVITTYCFARSYGAVTPSFNHPTLIAMESIGPTFMILQHFPFMKPLIFDMPLWLARIMNPEALAYNDLVEALVSQIDEVLENPLALENAEHEIIYHHLLTPPLGKDISIPTRKSLLDEASVLIFAGTDTVGNACMIGSFYVLSDDRVQGKLVEELKSSWPDLNDTIGFEKLEKLPYLTAVIKESLRMSHGTVSPLPRVVPTETVIAGNLVPANTVVSMGATFVHNNPQLFEDPMVFRPERWLNGHANGLETFLVPFSKGPRSCIGINLAWCELYLIFANIFRKVEMKIYDTTVDDLKVKALLTPKYRGKPLRVLAKRRGA